MQACSPPRRTLKYMYVSSPPGSRLVAPSLMSTTRESTNRLECSTVFLETMRRDINRGGRKPEGSRVAGPCPVVWTTLLEASRQYYVGGSRGRGCWTDALYSSARSSGDLPSLSRALSEPPAAASTCGGVAHGVFHGCAAWRREGDLSADRIRQNFLSAPW